MREGMQCPQSPSAGFPRLKEMPMRLQGSSWGDIGLHHIHPPYQLPWPRQDFLFHFLFFSLRCGAIRGPGNIIGRGKRRESGAGRCKAHVLDGPNEQESGWNGPEDQTLHSNFQSFSLKEPLDYRVLWVLHIHLNKSSGSFLVSQLTEWSVVTPI